MKISNIIGIFLILLLVSCNQTSDAENKQSAIKKESSAKGKLFIIGGGKRPPELIKELIKSSGLDKGKYAVILPMSSAEPDSAIYYSKKQFVDLGIKEDNVKGFIFNKSEQPEEWIRTIKKAGLIYIPGGDQMRFMDVVLNTSLHNAIHEAYYNGATIAGTSAGAAVMGKKMITGNEYKHPEYTGDFNTIEADNIEIREGLGLLPHVIVDQHFIVRMRMNRLISAAIEHPNQTTIGIDESTAILIENNIARVLGESQVIVMKNQDSLIQKKNGLLGAERLQLSIVLPGNQFALTHKKH